jgi:AGCS family alanine or glycine:cation symporter
MALRRASRARIATTAALAAALSVLLTLPAHAGIDETINSITAPAAVWFGKVVFFKIPIFGANLPLVVLWLIAGAVYFTWYMRFVNLRGFGHAISLVRGDYADPKSAGEVSHFQALATAVSGTVGIGNIGGVAVAVTIGGPGATFWLILAGFLGMSTKFVECTLGVKYRNENPDGSVSGGPIICAPGMVLVKIAKLVKPRSRDAT